MSITIPEPDDPRILRDVALDGYRLTTWETGRRCSTGQNLIGFAFYEPGATVPLFLGEDYGCSPMDCIDSDACLRGLLGFLTLRPGDTDSEYFEKYTPEQLAWCIAEAEALAFWSFGPDDYEETPPAFTDWVSP
jgi:hypothetical protein